MPTSPHFRYYLRVRYGECDAQKVVFNARYAEYVDLATTEFLRALGYGEALFSGEIDFQLVKQTIEWKAPARFDQVLEVSVYAKSLGNTSFTLAAEFRIAGEDRMIVMAETVYVLVKQHTLTKTPIPADLRNAIQEGGAGLATDHASYLNPIAATATAQHK
jgi:acyl-CoA thioester hydrolase